MGRKKKKSGASAKVREEVTRADVRTVIVDLIDVGMGMSNRGRRSSEAVANFVHETDRDVAKLNRLLVALGDD